MIAVTGHYISFTFIAVIIRDVVGIRGPDIAWLLSIYGIAGLVAMPLVARATAESGLPAGRSSTGGGWGNRRRASR